MPAKVIDIARADDIRDVVHRGVQALAEGRLVIFPTETVYGVACSARSESAVSRLIETKGRAANHPLALSLKSADEALDYVPRMSVVGRRLARRCWPGPVTLVFEDNHRDSLLRQLPSVVQEAVAPAGTIGVRVPAHDLVLEVMRLLAGPLVLTSANLSGEPDSVTAAEAYDALGDQVDLILDDGRCQFARPSSVARVDDNRVSMLREGVVGPATLHRLASLILLFVCTGNTCRSPMAQALARKLVAERLGAEPDDLPERGVLIHSAGVAAMAGGKPSPQAVDTMAALGLSLDDHESQPLTDLLVRHADLIVTLTRGHMQAIAAQWPSAVERTRLLRADGHDVADPIGGAVELYQACAEQIRTEVEKLVDQLDFEQLLPRLEPCE